MNKPCYLCDKKVDEESMFRYVPKGTRPSTGISLGTKPMICETCQQKHLEQTHG